MDLISVGGMVNFLCKVDEKCNVFDFFRKMGFLFKLITIILGIFLTLVNLVVVTANLWITCPIDECTFTKGDLPPVLVGFVSLAIALTVPILGCRMMYYGVHVKHYTFSDWGAIDLWCGGLILLITSIIGLGIPVLIAIGFAVTHNPLTFGAGFSIALFIHITTGTAVVWIIRPCAGVARKPEDFEMVDKDHSDAHV